MYDVPLVILERFAEEEEAGIGPVKMPDLLEE